MTIYHRILKLPEDIAAPDAYQLLGVSRFEEDQKLIKQAAMSRNALLQRLQNTESYEEVKRLEREVGEAMVCLMNPQKKAEYDRALAESEPKSQTETLSTIETRDNEPESVPQIPIPRTQPGETPWRSPAAWMRSHAGLLKGLGIAAVAVLLGLIAFAARS